MNGREALVAGEEEVGREKTGGRSPIVIQWLAKSAHFCLEGKNWKKSCSDPMVNSVTLLEKHGLPILSTLEVIF